MAGLSVVHDSPGRLRLRLPRDAKIAGLEQAVRQHPGVVGAAWSPLTRGLLILYRSQATTSPPLIDAVAAHTGLSPGADSAATPARRAAPSGSSELARAVRQAGSELNAAVGRATGGAMDLRILLPLALGGWALREVFRGRASPIAWSTALWYAHGLFRDYNLPGGES
jgi:hypothetical protein